MNAKQILVDRLTFDPTGSGTLRLFADRQCYRVVPEVKITGVHYLDPTSFMIDLLPRRYSGEYKTDTGSLIITDRYAVDFGKNSRGTIKFDNGLMGAEP